MKRTENFWRVATELIIVIGQFYSFMLFKVRRKQIESYKILIESPANPFVV